MSRYVCVTNIPVRLWCVVALLAIYEVVYEEEYCYGESCCIEYSCRNGNKRCPYLAFLPLLKLIIQIQMFLCFECQFLNVLAIINDFSFLSYPFHFSSKFLWLQGKCRCVLFLNSLFSILLKLESITNFEKIVISSFQFHICRVDEVRATDHQALCYKVWIMSCPYPLLLFNF